MSLDTLKLLADLRKATRLTPTEHHEPIWDHHLAEASDYEEGLFVDVDSLLAWHEANDEPPPAWAWAAKPVSFTLDAERAAKDQIEADSRVSEFAMLWPADIAELQALLDKWSADMTARCRWGLGVDRSRVIVLDEVRFAALLDGAEEN